MTDADLPERHCPHCGDAFKPVQHRHRYCSKSCKMTHWNHVHAQAQAERARAKRAARRLQATEGTVSMPATPGQRGTGT